MKQTENQKDSALLPDNTMQLLDGRFLPLYPREEKGCETNNEMYITSIKPYQSLKEQNKHLSTSEDDTPKDELQFFLDNVFFFVAHAEDILSDSRLFLAPVPVLCGLPFIGRNPFRYATLGVYIEWWMHNGFAVHKDERDKVSFIWALCGSPMTGSNRCAMVDENGLSTKITVGDFSKHVRSFRRINQRYHECKSLALSYSLRQVKDVLQNRHGSNYINSAYRNGLNWQNNWLINSKRELLDTIHDRNNRLMHHQMDAHAQELEKLVTQYLEMVEKDDKESATLQNKIREAKQKLKLGEISNVEYQQYISPMKRELDRLKHDPDFDMWNEIQQIFPQENYSLDDVLMWMESRKGTECSIQRQKTD